MTKTEWSWVFYDWANSAFTLIVVTAVMPVFFKTWVASGLPGIRSTELWGYANSTSSLILAFLAPFLGALADYRRNKKRFLIFFMSLGVLFTLSLMSLQKGDVALGLVFFVTANIGWAGANLFYDSLLIDVARRERMDWVSAAGFAWGYFGSVIPFIVGMQLISHPKWLGFDNALWPTRIVFAMTALWWLVFSIPLIRNVRQTTGVEPKKNPLGDAWRSLFATLAEIRKNPPVFWFLAAYFFYIDGIDTVISMATSYGTDLGLKTPQLLLIVLVIQIVAFPCAMIYGFLAKRVGPRAMLFTGIAVYLVIVSLASVLFRIHDPGLRLALYWVLAMLVATSQGGMQALSRSVFGGLIPAERSAGYFGFYNIFGRFAAIVGPTLMALTARFTGDTGLGVLSLAILFVFGGIFLAKVRIERPAR